MGMHAYIRTYNVYSLDPKFSQQTTGCAGSHKIQNVQYKNIVFHTEYSILCYNKLTTCIQQYDYASF